MISLRARGEVPGGSHRKEYEHTCRSLDRFFPEEKALQTLSASQLAGGEAAGGGF